MIQSVIQNAVTCVRKAKNAFFKKLCLPKYPRLWISVQSKHQSQLAILDVSTPKSISKSKNQVYHSLFRVHKMN